MNFKTTPIFAIAILVLLLTSCQNFDLKKSENSSLYFMFENSTEPDLTFVSASNDMLVSNLYYDAYLNKDYDVVIIDTAGRLHNKVNLMNELSKIGRVMEKLKENAPHEILLVLDGSTGQNAYEQAKQFSEVTKVTSMMVTKLDGTAKGGVVIGISDQLSIPIKYIGTGESIDDIQLFDKVDFVESFFQKNTN